MRERKAIDLKTSIDTGGYRLCVRTETHYFEGDKSDRQDEQPGWFLEQGIWLKGAPVEEETLIRAMGRGTPLNFLRIPSVGNREITNEPVGYEHLLHRDLVAKVRERPADYITREKLVAVLRR